MSGLWGDLTGQRTSTSCVAKRRSLCSDPLSSAFLPNKCVRVAWTPVRSLNGISLGDKRLK